MAFAINSEGSVVADGTEQNALIVTTTKFFGGSIDLTNMAGGDTTVIREYRKYSTGGAYVLIHTDTKSGAQTDKGLEFPMKPSAYGYKITIQQTGGVNRTYPFIFFEVS